MKYSHRAKVNMTNQLRGYLRLLHQDLASETMALKKARTFLKYKTPGVKSMVSRHAAGVRKTKRDIKLISARIRMRQRKDQIYKIL